MNPPERSGWRDLKSGLLVLAGAVPIAAGIFFLDVVRRALDEGPELVVVADEIEGLVRGADVWVAGRPAGRVTDVTFLPVSGTEAGRVAVRVVLVHDAAPALRSDARARIGRSALLSPPVVKLAPGSRDAPPLDFADTLIVVSTPGVREFRALADSGRTAARSLAAELSLLDEEMASGGGTLPRLRRDPAFARGLETRRARAAELRAAWQTSDLRRLVRDTTWRSGAARVAARRPPADTPAADDAARERLRRAIEDLRERAGRVTDRLEAAEGTLGRMAADDELREQAERNRALLDSLTKELGANPFRYLRFRLF